MFFINIDDEIKTRWIGEVILIAIYMEKFNFESDQNKNIEKDSKKMVQDLIQNGKTLLEMPNIQLMRKTFKIMPDMDPSRYNPASEALIKRYISKGFFSINPFVDVNNMLSAKLQIPFGIYDVNKLSERELIYRIGFKGEKYYTISQSQKNAEGKMVLSDKQGVIGSPISDSGRASISSDSSGIFVVGFLPIYTSLKKANEIIEKVILTFSKYFNPEIVQSNICENIR